MLKTWKVKNIEPQQKLSYSYEKCVLKIEILLSYPGDGFLLFVLDFQRTDHPKLKFTERISSYYKDFN